MSLFILNIENIFVLTIFICFQQVSLVSEKWSLWEMAGLVNDDLRKRQVESV